MTIYNYHHETGEYIGEATADPSPLEPRVWLIPDYATDIAPPTTGENEVAAFAADGEWVIKSDYRGQLAWGLDDYDSEGIVINYIGPLIGVSLTRPPVPEEIQAERNAAASIKQWPNVQSFMAEFLPEEIHAIANSAIPEVITSRFLLSTWLGHVVSNDPRITQGLDILLHVGIITNERRQQIITVPT